MEALANPDCGWFYRADADGFGTIPGSPIAYWASRPTIASFDNPLLGEIIPVKKGLDTGDNDTFLRCWHEVPFSEIGFGNKTSQSFISSCARWAPHDKGGEFRRWYGNTEWIIDWAHGGAALKASSANLRSQQYYFHDAITWSSISSGLCSFRSSDYGAISNTAGSSMYPLANRLLYLGLMNSSVVQLLLSFLAPTLNYSAGPISQIPKANWIKAEAIQNLVEDSIAQTKDDWDAFEISWGFISHPLV